VPALVVLLLEDVAMHIAALLGTWGPLFHHCNLVPWLKMIQDGMTVCLLAVFRLQLLSSSPLLRTHEFLLIRFRGYIDQKIQNRCRVI